MTRTSPTSLRPRLFALVVGASMVLVLSASASVIGPISVGSHGNEPIVTKAPDGTLYLSALQHIYRSTDNGLNWTELAGPIYASTLNLNSDSSISVDPGNRLYFTFDYPYAGSTAVCTSDDHGDTWSCNPSVVPGGTDRMWILAPTTSSAFEVTNEGLYETSFLQSTDRGTTWLPKSIGAGLLEPQTGPLLQQTCTSDVMQIVKVYGTTPQETPELKLYFYHPGTAGSVISDVRTTGLPLPAALPSASLGLDRELWVASEELNAAGGRQAVVARSTNAGQTWTKLPPIPETTTGTATFTSVAAGEPHHVGVLYYYTPDSGDPATLTSSTWSAHWAESFNADSPIPAWTITNLENGIHTGPICVAANCMGADRFSGDFITAIIDGTGAGHLSWMKEVAGSTTIRYARVQSGTPFSYTAAPCGLIPSAVVSRKTHGNAGTFDVNLPQIGPAGIECRTGPTQGSHTLVATFPNALTSVTSLSATATTSNGTQNLAAPSGSIGTDSHANEYTINLTGAPNASHVYVTLHGVTDSVGNTGDLTLTMDLLLSDVDLSTNVDGNDVSAVQGQVRQPVDQTNFRMDVDITGLIDGNDVSLTQGHTRDSLTPANQAGKSTTPSKTRDSLPKQIRARSHSVK